MDGVSLAASDWFAGDQTGTSDTNGSEPQLDPISSFAIESSLRGLSIGWHVLCLLVRECLGSVQ